METVMFILGVALAVFVVPGEISTRLQTSPAARSASLSETAGWWSAMKRSP